ncbi:MAG: AAA family ATPase [Anaerolineae bacterium]|nr:AAA family ATPase [Anaerolineae bacterium]
MLIDCPPHLGILTVNALAAADAVLVPFVPEFLSTRGLQAVFVVINRVRQELNYGLHVAGPHRHPVRFTHRHAQALGRTGAQPGRR